MSQLRASAQAQVKVRVQASPGLKLLAHLLELNAQEMEQLLTQELEENPALEWSEEAKVVMPVSTPTFVSFETNESEEDIEESLPDEDSGDWLAVPPLQLKEHVRSQLLLSLPPDQHPIAEYLVECLDERGYLNTEIEEVAMQFNCSPGEVERVLHQLQRCDPPGVGARNLQECLLIQLEALLEEPCNHHPLLPIAYQVVKETWHNFARGRYSSVAKRLKVDEPTIQQVLQLIREELRPYPAEGFSDYLLPSMEPPAVEPDIIIRYKNPTGLCVELRGPTHETLRLSPSYAERFLILRQQACPADHGEREHIFQYVSRARLFLQALQQRQQTLKRIVEVLVQRQFPFLFTGDPRFLQPMTRADIADATGLHRSTVGRAVRNKWLQLPNGSIVPLDVFFDASYRVAMLIQQLIEEQEDENHFLTDAEIAQKLAEMGIHVARRTVSKYRNRHRILSSRWRERARLIG
jgi:RNA polymerase sigma-54 factor